MLKEGGLGHSFLHDRPDGETGLGVPRLKIFSLLQLHPFNLPLINAVPSLSFHSSLWWLVHDCETATALEPLQISPMRLASVPNDAETARVPACEALRVHCGQVCHGIRPPRRQYQTSSPGTPLCNLRQAVSNRPPGQVPPRSHILSGPHKPGELVQGFATANVGLQLMRQRCALCSDGPRNGQHPWVTFRGPQINLGRKGSPSGLGMVHDPTTASCLDCER